MYAFKSVKDAYIKAAEFSGEGRVATFPPYVTFELRNSCNFRCVMCPRTYIPSDSRQIDIQTFQRHVEEISAYGSLIRFIGWDEPFSYGSIREAISLVKQKGLLLHITTNGSLLDDSMIRHIVESPVDSIIVSFQGLTEDEYCFMRKVSPAVHSRVIAGMKQLFQARRGVRPRIMVTTTITERDRAEDKDAFVDFHLQHADEVQITGFTDLTAIADGFDKPTIWGDLGLTKPNLREDARCFLPNYEMKIRWDGTVFACCTALNDDIAIGSSGAQTLLQQWTSSKATRLRKSVGEGRLDEFKDCQTCSIRYEYPEINNPITNTAEKSFESFVRSS